MRTTRPLLTVACLLTLILGACSNPSYTPDQADGESLPDPIALDDDPEARELFESVVEAMGGEARIREVEALVLEGRGEIRNLGQNRTPEEENPVWEITAFHRDIALDGRMRTREVREARFPYAGATTQRRDEVIDQSRAFRIGEDQTTSSLSSDRSAGIRRDFLHHPLTLARAALADDTTFGAPGAFGALARSEEGEESIAIRLGSGERVRLEIDADTRLPRAIVSADAHPNLGDVDVRTEFSDYTEVDGLGLPRRLERSVDRFPELALAFEVLAVDGEVEIPPVDEASATPAPPDSFAVTVGVERVADRIWWLHGSGNHRSVLFEFDDHLTLFEVPSSEARTQAVITTARTLVPDKPLTEAVVSHHHFDHSAGLRSAVAFGLTIITHRSNVRLFEELVGRPHTREPDVLERFPAEMELIPIDDTMVLEDDGLRVELYHVLDNPREGTNVIAWVPGDRVLVQADLYDSGWAQHPWAGNFRANLRRRGLEVELHVPVHGEIQTDAEVMQTLADAGADLN